MLVGSPGRTSEKSRRIARVAMNNAAMLLGAALIAWSGGIHLHLWQSGYRGISTIGPLFLLQAIAAFALALLVALTRRLVPAVLGAGFLASTIGGLVWSAEWGLFGFKDSFSAPFAQESLFVEMAGIVVLSVGSIARIRSSRTALAVGPRE